MSEEIKYIDAEEFQAEGYLQEVNRQFFHPYGLALEVRREDSEDTFREWLEQWFDAIPDGPDHIEIALGLLREFGIVPGKMRIGGVWDYRDDPEGIYFGPGAGPEPDKADNVADKLLSRADARKAALGYLIQPIPREVVEVHADPVQ